MADRTQYMHDTVNLTVSCCQPCTIMNPISLRSPGKELLWSRPLCMTDASGQCQALLATVVDQEMGTHSSHSEMNDHHAGWAILRTALTIILRQQEVVPAQYKTPADTNTTDVAKASSWIVSFPGLSSSMSCNTKSDPCWGWLGLGPRLARQWLIPTDSI